MVNLCHVDEVCSSWWFDRETQKMLVECDENTGCGALIAFLEPIRGESVFSTYCQLTAGPQVRELVAQSRQQAPVLRVMCRQPVF